MSLQRARFRGDCSTNEFQEVLKRLKRDGCNLLVTGAVSEDVTIEATRTLLGAPTAERKRILALADSQSENVRERLPSGVESEDPDVWLVDQETCQRSVPKAAESAATHLPADESDRSPLGRLREEIILAIDFFADAGLDPSELRLSVSSLGRLTHEHGPDRVARFVRSVSAMVRGVHGMAHYHLPTPDDDEMVERLSGLFDARVELRKRDGVPTEQRWHVPEHDQTTEWLRL
ncbi:DUF7504 family protein [Halorussus pelagicus]|uniref:DUF7504 family protein n=1 Tax=Halorussus pelagicus TaxID=2505977 RepID=UPI000FFB5711|nr:hypothetical protein [Halorussus pelagicus]